MSIIIPTDAIAAYYIFIQCVSKTSSLISLFIPERLAMINRMVQHEPLSVKNIKKLSPHSNFYIIPHNQRQARTLALILYTRDCRDGATEEAHRLEMALRSTGCHIINSIEWYTVEDLGTMIYKYLKTEILASCSLLTICMMSHGTFGTITGCDQKQIAINDILHQITQILPPHLPLVSTMCIIHCPSHLFYCY